MRPIRLIIQSSEKSNNFKKQERRSTFLIQPSILEQRTIMAHYERLATIKFNTKTSIVHNNHRFGKELPKVVSDKKSNNVYNKFTDAFVDVERYGITTD